MLGKLIRIRFLWCFLFYQSHFISPIRQGPFSHLQKTFYRFEVPHVKLAVFIYFFNQLFNNLLLSISCVPCWPNHGSMQAPVCSEYKIADGFFNIWCWSYPHLIFEDLIVSQTLVNDLIDLADLLALKSCSNFCLFYLKSLIFVRLCLWHHLLFDFLDWDDNLLNALNALQCSF